MSVRLVSLNIQRDRQLRTVVPFFRESGADVACIQELFERDIPLVAEALGAPHHLFAPMSRHVSLTPSQVMGLGIFSKYPFSSGDSVYYAGDPAHLPEQNLPDSSTWNNKNFILLYADVLAPDASYRIATTHLTWTPDGNATELQRTHTSAMLKVLEGVGELVLTGDFNAPRGKEMFSMLAAKYKDNVPPHYTSSLDPDLHRAKGLKLMVDGIFSTPAYRVSGVEMVCGVSDHCALVGEIERED